MLVGFRSCKNRDKYAAILCGGHGVNFSHGRKEIVAGHVLKMHTVFIDEIFEVLALVHEIGSDPSEFSRAAELPQLSLIHRNPVTDTFIWHERAFDAVWQQAVAAGFHAGQPY